MKTLLLSLLCLTLTGSLRAEDSPAKAPETAPATAAPETAPAAETPTPAASTPAPAGDADKAK